VHYYDEKNEAAAAKLFGFFQIMMLLTVYLFAYTAYVGLNAAAEASPKTATGYLPEIIAVLFYPTLLYRMRKRFWKGRYLSAVAWCMAWASVIIVALYLHLDRSAG